MPNTQLYSHWNSEASWEQSPLAAVRGASEHSLPPPSPHEVFQPPELRIHGKQVLKQGIKTPGVAMEDLLEPTRSSASSDTFASICTYAKLQLRV